MPITTMAAVLRRRGGPYDIETLELADPQVFIPWLIGRHLAGRFNHAPLVRAYPFARINEAVADMAAGRAVKPVLVMD